MSISYVIFPLKMVTDFEKEYNNIHYVQELSTVDETFAPWSGLIIGFYELPLTNRRYAATALPPESLQAKEIKTYNNNLTFYTSLLLQVYITSFWIVINQFVFH
jgi:hypothetical protein